MHPTQSTKISCHDTTPASPQPCGCLRRCGAASPILSSRLRCTRVSGVTAGFRPTFPPPPPTILPPPPPCPSPGARTARSTARSRASCSSKRRCCAVVVGGACRASRWIPVGVVCRCCWACSGVVAGGGGAIRPRPLPAALGPRMELMPGASTSMSSSSWRESSEWTSEAGEKMLFVLVVFWAAWWGWEEVEMEDACAWARVRVRVWAYG
ncbi:hypothetical protein B0T25DRAFT_558291 [Lasiosphaeria hispida]|uniref:Uncharacterized protein n=1 Tax=Lasiosphaeria hispida TaxID=260671 RepID=A0AAJ0H684_9PEZI|nr:hypothetical protein B0T25DRAFT_558291 [Lasiosphaeria hispida]